MVEVVGGRGAHKFIGGLRNGPSLSSRHHRKWLRAAWLTSVSIQGDTAALWEAEWQKSVSDGSFSLPLCLPFFISSSSAFCRRRNFFVGFVFCVLPIGRSQVASLSPSWRAADVTAGPLNGQRDKSFIWRSRSPPPPPSSPPPLCFLGRYAESLLAAVCVKGRKGGG